MRGGRSAWAAIAATAFLLLVPLLHAEVATVEQKQQERTSKTEKHRPRVRLHRVAPPLDLSQIPLTAALPRLDFVPSGPVTISYENDELSINALNTPLEHVLRQVCKQFDASVEIPPGLNDHVFGQIGPGPAREVIASLLYGVKFNYVILASAEDPNRLARVVLSPKPPPLSAADAKLPSKRPNN